MGFILALPPSRANPPADAWSPAVRIAMLYSQGTDFDRVNYIGIGDVLGLPGSSRKLNRLRQRRPPRPSESLTRDSAPSGPVAADQGQSKRLRMPLDAFRCRV